MPSTSIINPLLERSLTEKEPKQDSKFPEAAQLGEIHHMVRLVQEKRKRLRNIFSGLYKQREKKRIM